jgi:hypothetical protein
VSAISGDFTDSTAQSDPLTGRYRVNGLTPGASYAVYVDQILIGGFSTPPANPLPGVEEFYNGPDESNNRVTRDDPSEFTPVASTAGTPRTGVDVIFNVFREGEPLPVGDDGSVELPLPFRFRICGQEFSTVFVNANGNLTFGQPSSLFFEFVPAFLGGPPRLAALLDDLNPAAGGTVTFEESEDRFKVLWDAVPEFPDVGANTFSITLDREPKRARFDYGELEATDGLAGLSCGGAVTSGFENERNLRTDQDSRTIDMEDRTAVFEVFTARDNDLDHFRLTFVGFRRGFKDRFEPNDDIDHAERIALPFNTVSLGRFSEIEPTGGDVDFYRFRAKAGDILAIEIVRGAFDATLGVFDADTGELLASNDDGGSGLLSRLLLSVDKNIRLAVAVSAFPDLDFNGDGAEGGRYVLSVKRYRGEVLDVGDETTTELPLGFDFPFQGRTWKSVFVNSNGNLTFGEGSLSFDETVERLLAGPPRIAPLWDDLDPTGGLVIAEQRPHSTQIHFVSVPEFFSDSPNYFTVRLQSNGHARIRYEATARSDSLVGVTEGNDAADPGETDISRLDGVVPAQGTTYELFEPLEPFDLSFRSWRLRP